MIVGNVVIATTKVIFKVIGDIVNIHFIDCDKIKCLIWFIML